jgi:hypothetical protein
VRLITHSPPHHLIAARSRAGSPLILRVRNHNTTWLRVHEDGSLERARGGPHDEDEVVPLAERTDARWLRDTLREFLWARDLAERSPFAHHYPVQAFLAGEEVVEGFVGVEIEMACRTDVLGLRSRGKHFQVRRADEHRVVDELDALLRFLWPTLDNFHE